MIKLIITLFMLATLGFTSSILPKKAEVAYTMDYTKKTRCVVRNFFVYKDPRWVSKLELANGKKIFFSSPKSMFEFYFRPGRWFNVGVKSEKDFKDIIVTDYNSMKLVNAKDAYYIYGSRAISPAGDDLVAFETKEGAEAFSKSHSGKRIFKFNEISDALIRLINGRI